MDKKAYWKLRKIILTVLFKIKVCLYRILDFISEFFVYNSLRKRVLISILIGIMKATIVIVAVRWFDGLILKFKDIQEVDNNLFIPTVIGGVSVAGVILGLYCSNITSIYSLRYSNAPKIIAIAFQYDRLSRRCISRIVDYIAFCFLIVLTTMLKGQISWATVTVFIIWSIAVVVSYSIAGNRAYELSDIYRVAEDSNRVIYRIISKWLNRKFFDYDANFQNHFLKVVNKQIELLKSIQKYGEAVERRDNSDNSTVTEFMLNNLVLVELYWMQKMKVARSSVWYRNMPKYQRWHLTSNIETSLALRTGTMLRTKEKHNYWWFEEELISINKRCLSNLFNSCDYSSIYSYLLSLRNISSTAIKCKEARLYLEHADWIRHALEKSMVAIEADSSNRKIFAGVVEALSLLYLDLILESSAIYEKFDIERQTEKVITALDSGRDVKKIECIRSRESIDFYKKIITEVKVEGMRITPDWIIKQQIAKEEYVYLNSLLDLIREGINHIFGLGKMLLERKLYFEACIILTRFYEYASKLSRFINIVESQKKSLYKLKIDKDNAWDDFRIGKLTNTIGQWKISIPALLVESASLFAIETWNTRDEYPDFIGGCYNHICEDAVVAITSNDKKQFEMDFENLSKLMLLYQEYIRTDFINNKDLYRVEYAYYMHTSPIVEWAQIGGLAIIWGEFFRDKDWKAYVSNSSELIFIKDGVFTDLASKLVEYVQQRDQFMFSIGNRDILETEWQQIVANAIRDNSRCETEYDLFGRSLKTDSKILKAFCPNFIDMGFATDPSEVFWVICVNPYLSDDKKFHTRDSWEDRLNE